MRKKKRDNWYRVYWVKLWYWYDENVFDFRLSDAKGEDEEDIAKVKLIESLQKQADKEIIPKKVTGGLFDYYFIFSKEKKNQEDLFRSSFYI